SFFLQAEDGIRDYKVTGVQTCALPILFTTRSKRIRAGDVEPVVLRLSTVFGLSPRMRFDLVVNTLTVRAVADGTISIIGGNQWRPNVHCRDAARAFIAALEAPGERVAGEIFNVGGDALNHTIADLGDMVAEIVGDVEVKRQPD